jgi:hypothetical protein
MLKKLLIATAGAVLAVLSATASANGNWSLGLYFGFPAYPAYVAPPPAYYYPPPRVYYPPPPPPAVWYGPRPYYAPPHYGPPGHYRGGKHGWKSGGHPGYGWR